MPYTTTALATEMLRTAVGTRAGWCRVDLLQSPALPCNEHTMSALVLVYVLCVLHSGSQRAYASPSIGCLRGGRCAVRAASSTGSALR